MEIPVGLPRCKLSLNPSSVEGLQLTQASFELLFFSHGGSRPVRSLNWSSGVMRISELSI